MFPAARRGIPTWNTWNPPRPVFNDDPLQFFDDELLVDDQKLVDPTSDVNSTEVTIKVVPERPALAASDLVSLFALLVGLKAPPLSKDAKRAPVDIVTVLDVSGSMWGTKLELVKRAVHFVFDNLGGSDRLSIVAFSDEAKRLLRLQRMTEGGRENAHRVVEKLAVHGGMNIVKGLAKGAKVLDERRNFNPVSSTIFLSDGRDTNNSSYLFGKSGNAPTYLNLLPASIYPKNEGELVTIPVLKRLITSWKLCSAALLPKTNYVLKRLITSWKDQYPDLAHYFSCTETPPSYSIPVQIDDKPQRFTIAAAATYSPTSVISQASVETVINALKPCIL